MKGVERSFKSNSTYVYKRKIGTGGNADAFLYSRRTEGCPPQNVVLKVLKEESEESLQELINDGEKLNCLKHPNILRTLGFEKISNEKIALILEYIPGGTLKSIVKNIPYDETELVALFIARKLTSALISAHHSDIIHGDISSKNILISNEGEIKLADFGIAMMGSVENVSRRPLKGSVDYLSPELWKGERPSVSSDLFSLGLVIYEVLSGGHPLQSSSVLETKRKLGVFLDQRPWRNRPQWTKFFDSVFEVRGSELSAAQVVPLLPQKFLDEENLRQKLRKCMTLHQWDLQSKLTQTVTMAMKALDERRSQFWIATFVPVVFILLSMTPVAIGGNLQLKNRLKPCVLTVTSRPWGEVFIDGVSRGLTPLINISISSGPHNFLWRNYRGQTVRKTINAYENGMLVIQIKK